MMILGSKKSTLYYKLQSRRSQPQNRNREDEIMQKAIEESLRAHGRTQPRNRADEDIPPELLVK